MSKTPEDLRITNTAATAANDSSKKDDKKSNLDKITRSVIIVGNSGSGKSLLGNLLVGEEIFLHGISKQEVTTKISCQTVRTLSDKFISLYDIPGLLCSENSTLLRNNAALSRVISNSTSHIIVFIFSNLHGRLIAQDISAFRQLIKNYSVKSTSLIVVFNQAHQVNGWKEWMVRMVLQLSGWQGPLRMVFIDQLTKEAVTNKVLFNDSLAEMNRMKLIAVIESAVLESHPKSGEFIWDHQELSILTQQIKQFYDYLGMQENKSSVREQMSAIHQWLMENEKLYSSIVSKLKTQENPRWSRVGGVTDVPFEVPIADIITSLTKNMHRSIHVLMKKLKNYREVINIDEAFALDLGKDLFTRFSENMKISNEFRLPSLPDHGRSQDPHLENSYLVYKRRILTNQNVRTLLTIRNSKNDSEIMFFALQISLDTKSGHYKQHFYRLEGDNKNPNWFEMVGDNQKTITGGELKHGKGNEKFLTQFLDEILDFVRNVANNKRPTLTVRNAISASAATAITSMATAQTQPSLNQMATHSTANQNAAVDSSPKQTAK